MIPAWQNKLLMPCEAAAASRGLTPFVGREDELRLLMSRWERALDGERQVVLIIGEAGIGKSRLLQRFHEQIGAPRWLLRDLAGDRLVGDFHLLNGRSPVTS
jgi:transcriptional regulator with AAA-type ATPase domain